jgi:hypothetical protein
VAHTLGATDAEIGYFHRAIHLNALDTLGRK